MKLTSKLFHNKNNKAVFLSIPKKKLSIGLRKKLLTSTKVRWDLEGLE